jgi:hypothetical protein
VGQGSGGTLTMRRQDWMDQASKIAPHRGLLPWALFGPIDSSITPIKIQHTLKLGTEREKYRNDSRFKQLPTQSSWVSRGSGVLKHDWNQMPNVAAQGKGKKKKKKQDEKNKTEKKTDPYIGWPSDSTIS